MVSFAKLVHTRSFQFFLLSTPMGVDYIVIGFDMEIQPLVTHTMQHDVYVVSAVRIDE